MNHLQPLPRETPTSGAFFMSMDYQEQLKDRRWIELRNRVINRDYRSCRKCTSKLNLHVHHTRYIEGRMAWEYDERYLITLCEKCHKKEHIGKDLSDFVKEPDAFIESVDLLKFSYAALRALSCK